MRYEAFVPIETSSPSALEKALRKVAELESALATTKETLTKTSAQLATVTDERDKLRRAYELLKGQLEMLRRRIFLAKAERIDTRQLEIEFAATKAKLDALAKEMGGEPDAAGTAMTGPDDADQGRPSGKAKRTSKGSGRPNLRDLDMPEERVEILDPALEGKAERIGFEETCLLGHRRASPVRVVMAVATYKVKTEEGTDKFVTADKPKEIYDRRMLAPSFIAHLLTKKFRWGMPFQGTRGWPRFAPSCASPSCAFRRSSSRAGGCSRSR